MGNDKTIGELSRNFIDLLAARTGPAKIRLIPFSAEEWVRGAWSTVKKTLRGQPEDTKPYRDRKRGELLQFSAKSLDAPSFDGEWSDLLSRLQDTAPWLTLGQAQKIASIFLKYGFCATNCNESNPVKPLVDSCAYVFPVPIDQSVLIGLLRHPGGSEYIRWVGLMPKIRERNGDLVAWSKLKCHETYTYVQTLCRGYAREKGCSPLEYEMRYLWTARIENSSTT